MNENKANRYHRLRRRIQVVTLVATGAALFAIVLPGVDWTRALVHPLAGLPATGASARYALQVLAFAVALTVLLELVSLPGGYYRSMILDRRYGISRQSEVEWWRDYLKSAALGVVMSVAIAATVYGSMALWSPGWWLIAGLLLAALGALLALAAPVLLFPLFYRFERLPDGELSQRLTHLAARAGVRVLGVYNWALGDKSSSANAALVGMGPTRRILLSDTLLDQYSPDEIEVIIAHELAHHVHGDLWKGVVVEAAVGVLALGVGHLALLGAGPRLGIHDLADPAGMPLLALAAGGASVVVAPFLLAQSRRHERRADLFAIDLTGKADPFISAMRRLGEQNLAEDTPSRIVEWLFHSHPSLAQRIAFAQGWKTGRSPGA